MKPFVIAEIGVNFYDTAREKNISPLEAAKLYILEAFKAGVSAVKFQSYKADTIVSKNSPAYWDLSKEPTTTQHALFSKHDGFDKEDYQELCNYCKEVGVAFLSTPFDFNSADYLENMVDIYKISSSDLTNIPFIRYISRKGKPIFLSVGASYLFEIDEVVRAIKEEGNNDICILHCVLSYPIQTIRGIDEKTVLPCEIIPRREARRSIVLTRDLKAGTTLSMEHLTFKRPGTGIAPKYLDIVIGKQVKKDLLEDTVLTWDMI